MGRIEANASPNNTPGQSRSSTDEFRFRPGTQAPDTIDIVPPPSEYNEENQHEIHQKQKTGPSRTRFENQEDLYETNPPVSAAQAVQFPPQNAEIRVKRSQIPARNNPQAYPPPESYPPEKPGAFHQPQAYPPPGNDQVHSFPPQAGPVNYPPRQQVFAQPNVAQFTPPATNYSYAAANINATNMSSNPQGVPGSPYGNIMNGIPAPVYNPPTQPWSSSLFDCMNDPENAIITACLPCVTFGQIAEIIDEGQTTCGTSGGLYGLIACCIAMPCLISCGYRTKLRSKLGLMETTAPDWIVHCFCEWCALCQEYRELKGRGLDPAIGWQGNMMRQQQAVAMTPPMHPTMGR